MHTTHNHRELALAYHRRLPAHIHTYLERRGIPDKAIHQYRLGWDGEHITIPITDRERRVTFFRLARKPADDGAPIDIISSAGGYNELFGWERLSYRRDLLVICEGEFDRLVLEGKGIPAVTPTGGPDAFLKLWAKEFGKVQKVFICFHNDGEGRFDSRAVANFIPHSKIVHLPAEVGEGGTISDFFVRLGKVRADFNALMDRANPLSGEVIPSPYV
jgi:hypothetical protein